MNRLLPFDRVLLGSVAALLLLGTVMIGSASLSVAEAHYGDPLRIVGRWLLYVPAGVTVTWWLSRLDISWWQATAVPLLGLGLLLLALVFVPGLGVEINGARRWLNLPGITLQPVELFKPLLIIYLAYYMSAFPERLQRFASGLAPMLVVLAAAVVLLLAQPDFGNAALLTFCAVALWFVGGVPTRHLFGVVAVAAPIGLLLLVAEPYRVKRLLSFTDPWADPFGAGYQLVQSMLAYGSGGLQGTGLGQGVQKLFYLPEAFTDFIAAVIAEELGLGGSLALVLLFSLILWRGVKVALGTDEPFRRLLVLGATLLIGATFMINLGAATGILPTKGMPMPFISYGGSALIGNCALLGLIFAVQRHQPENTRREAGS